MEWRSSVGRLVMGVAAAWAATATADERPPTDIPYASVSPAQRLDLYRPDGHAPPHPVIVAIHGGGFRSGDKSGGPLRSALAGRRWGYAVASVNYRLSGEAPFPAAVRDVKAAIRFLRANAGVYGLDPKRFAAWGESAGGNLAVMAATSDGVAAFEDPALGHPEQSSAVQAAVDFYGPIEFTSMDAQLRANGVLNPRHGRADSNKSQYLGRPMVVAADLAAKANPAAYITAATPPVMIVHGQDDTVVPAQQSIDLARRLTAALGRDKVRLVLIDDAGHGGPAFETRETLTAVFSFLDRALDRQDRRAAR